MTDIILNAIIFLASEISIAGEATYWRPIKWACYWIALSAITGTIGIIGAYKRSSGTIIVFIVLQLLLASVNLAHVNQMRGEMIRTCKISQVTFQNCDPAHNALANTYLSGCIYTNTCQSDTLGKTNCEAVSSKHCSNQSDLESLFWINAIVNFLTYAEPTWFAIMLLVRMEITSDCAPDPPLEDEEYPNPGLPTMIFKCQEDGESEAAPDQARLLPPPEGDMSKNDQGA
eukprot:TRINITY_DN1521_c0_g1_i1.p1 TRINITY_DN1521_c0_g1~~TRINITY_DN1521_c0_g1_i1.p1  ORF type:complete len:230 (-),score=37.93 TRINITY_DN1521_c0_g1_i1:130-819(-)